MSGPCCGVALPAIGVTQRHTQPIGNDFVLAMPLHFRLVISLDVTWRGAYYTRFGSAVIQLHSIFEVTWRGATSTASPPRLLAAWLYLPHDVATPYNWL